MRERERERESNTFMCTPDCILGTCTCIHVHKCSLKQVKVEYIHVMLHSIHCIIVVHTHQR